MLHRIDWSVTNYCLDCGHLMVPATNGTKRSESTVVHASSGFCHKCYSRIRRNTYDNPHFVDWAVNVYCSGCTRQLKTSSSPKTPENIHNITHYGRGMCKRCYVLYEGVPPSVPKIRKMQCLQCNDTVKGTYRKKYCSRSCYVTAYRLSNPEIIQKSKYIRRANMKTDFVVSSKDYQRLLTRHQNCCAYCMTPIEAGINLTWDHIIPIARGGEHRIGNLIPSCRRCNTKKHTKFIVEWKKYESTRSS